MSVFVTLLWQSLFSLMFLKLFGLKKIKKKINSHLTTTIIAERFSPGLLEIDIFYLYLQTPLEISYLKPLRPGKIKKEESREKEIRQNKKGPDKEQDKEQKIFKGIMRTEK